MTHPDPLADMDRVFPDAQDAPLPLWAHGRAELGCGSPRLLPAPGDLRWAPQRRDGERPTPPGFVAEETDETTGKTVGWEPLDQSSFARWHAEAVWTANDAMDEVERAEPWPSGTYELIGPKVNGNPEREDEHALIAHQFAEEVFLGPRDAYSYDLLRQELLNLRDVYGAEGVVWHHPDGRMAKLKARDFLR